jgi:hypothetical protein
VGSVRKVGLAYGHGLLFLLFGVSLGFFSREMALLLLVGKRRVTSRMANLRCLIDGGNDRGRRRRRGGGGGGSIMKN